MPDLARIACLAIAVALAACAPRSGPPAPVSLGGDSRPALSRAEAASGVVEVQPGDTLYAVARRAGTPVRALIEANRLQAPYRIQAGQRLQIPAAAVAPNRAVAASPAATSSGVPPASAPVASASAPSLAALPRASVDSAPVAAPPPAASPPAASPAGNPETPAPVAGSAPAVVMPPPAAPGGEATAPLMQSPAAASRPTSSTPPAFAPAPAPAPTAQSAEPGASVPSAATATGDAPPARAGRFLWPLRGNVVSTFGQKPGGLQNDGINIAAPLGTPVRATENGVVVYAGNELKGFGNLLLLRHADGWMSAYAHLDEISIARGASVGRGQVIGKVGQTGSVATPQLHFELRRGGRAVDPRGQLAPLQTAAAD